MKREDKCQRFLEILPDIEWFIKEYFKPELLEVLKKQAENRDGCTLMDNCQNIWFMLPDHKFNIRVNPPGWNKFLSLLED